MAGPWIAVISADHAAAAARDGFFACSHGDGRAAARPSLGDRFAYYAPREGLGEGEPVQAFVALGRILDAAPSPRTIGGFEAQVRQAEYEPVGRVPVRPLLPALGFLRDKGSHWGMAFRRGLFAVSEEDFAVVERALRDG
ncbi:MAG: EVE domain-containing protein [Amaricoccus sp.]